MADKPRIGWIGTGVMGHSMAGHLIEAGYSLTVFNRTPSKCQSLVEKGATPAGSPREVGEKSDVVFTMVGYPADVESVTIGPNGCLGGMKAGSILCDMTTSSPTLAGKIANRAAVDVGAMNATLSIFVGGSDEGYARILPLLQIMGQKILHCGRAGMGQQAKLANQAAIAGVMFSVCESLIYAQQAGLDVRKWHELVSVGAAGSVAMKTLGSRIMDGDFRPGFFIDHFVKDLGLILEECRRMHLVLPGTALAEQFYRSMQAKGHGKEGTQALVRALAEFSGKVWTPLIGG